MDPHRRPPTWAAPEALDDIVGLPPDPTLMAELRSWPGLDLSRDPWTGRPYDVGTG